MMIFLFSVMGFVGAFFVWKKLSRSLIAKGKNKYFSHVLGFIAANVVWMFIVGIGAAIFLPTPLKYEQEVVPKETVKEVVPRESVKEIVKREPVKEAVPEHSYVTDKKLTVELIKSISPQITSSDIYEQAAGEDKGFNHIDVHIDSLILTGGANDWNTVALKIFPLSKKLFQRKDIAQVAFVVFDKNNNLQWARITVDRKKLPNNWNELSYLQFFSYSEPMAGTIETDKWLSEFYAKYSSANPR